MNHESLEKLIFFGIKSAFKDNKYQVYSKYHVRGNSNKTVRDFESLINPCPNFSADGLVVRTDLMDKPDKFQWDGIQNVAVVFGKSDHNGLVWIPYQRLKELRHDQVLFSNFQYNTLQVKRCQTQVIVAVTHPVHQSITFSKPLPLGAFTDDTTDGFFKKPSPEGFAVTPGAFYHNFKRWEEMPGGEKVPMSFFENEQGYSLFWTLRHQADMVKGDAKKVNYHSDRSFYLNKLADQFNQEVDKSTFNLRPFIFSEGNTGKSLGLVDIEVSQIDEAIEHFKKEVTTPMDKEDMLAWCVKNYPQITVTPEYSPWENPGLYSISKKILHRRV